MPTIQFVENEAGNHVAGNDKEYIDTNKASWDRLGEGVEHHHRKNRYGAQATSQDDMQGGVGHGERFIILPRHNTNEMIRHNRQPGTPPNIVQQ